MFSDNVKISVASGKGGAGCVSFRREKFVTQGGPNGGDGGRGGDVWIVCDNNTHTLSHFKGNKNLKADGGKPGLGSRMTGKSGKILEVIVPPGTEISDADTGEFICDMTENGQRFKYLTGGKGGLGNFHFKSSTNQQPRYAQPGQEALERNLKLDLKLIADVGLVGFPNVGKSTLISTVSNARPEVSNYEFTTLTPKLGEVNIGDYDAFVMADIPGIIGGASDGKGLGLKFLRHIERTKTLLFMIDLANYRDMAEQYNTLREELLTFSSKLEGNNFAIALTRLDALPAEEVTKKVKEFFEVVGVEQSSKSDYGFSTELGFYEQSVKDDTLVYDNTKPFFIAPISSVMRTNIEACKFGLYELVKLARLK